MFDYVLHFFQLFETSFDEILVLVSDKVSDVMKTVRGSWPTWPPPAEVNVDNVTYEDPT